MDTSEGSANQLSFLFNDHFTKIDIHLSYQSVTSTQALQQVELNPHLFNILDYRDREKYQQYMEQLQNGVQNQQKLKINA